MADDTGPSPAQMLARAGVLAAEVLAPAAMAVEASQRAPVHHVRLAPAPRRGARGGQVRSYRVAGQPARDGQDTIIWSVLDVPDDSTLSAELVDLVAVMASRTVQLRFSQHFVPAGRVTGTVPLAEWPQQDRAGLRANGSLALGLAARCGQLIGPGPEAQRLAREALFLLVFGSRPTIKQALSGLLTGDGVDGRAGLPGVVGEGPAGLQGHGG